jgi:transcriptional regulator with XRE-family HTH domain
VPSVAPRTPAPAQPVSVRGKSRWHITPFGVFANPNRGNSVVRSWPNRENYSGVGQVTVPKGPILTAKRELDLGPDFAVPGDNSETGRRAARLREAVKKAGTVKEIAARSGVPFGTIQNYLGGREMKLGNAASLATAIGVSLEWLVWGHEVAQREPSPVLSGVEAAPEGYVAIPRYEVRAGAGSGVINPSERVISQITMSEEYIRRVLRRLPKNMCILEALGDSMAPTIRDGDVIMIDISVSELRASSIYVLLVGNQLLVKRLHRLTSGSILIISDNKEHYPPEEITAATAEADPIRIVGEVVWKGGPTLF